ncbi:MAG: enterochelin esterase [Chloroflexi bacterium]|nr:MAG: enterochelin esterase [Chloroflexota bacterium]
MPAPWSYEPAGRWAEHQVDSALLRGNPLGDPHTRPLWVYLPPGYDDDESRRYPSVYVIQGMTGQLDMWRNRTAFRRNFPELLDELFADQGCPPAVVVFVDCWTSYGGSQFLDSPGTGRYHSYLCSEVVPFVDAEYRTINAPAHRGIMGKSSGGYGAMVTPMLRPDLFGGLATHAGDALFELCYLPEFGPVARALRDHYGGAYERFWADFRSRPAGSGKDDDSLVNAYAMAACYSADADGTVRLPLDPATGMLIPEVWERWLRWDPVRMVPGHAEQLKSLRAIYVDAGRRDEYFLDLGAEAFRRALAGVGVTDVHFELFDAGHAMIEYRYPIALRYLTERLRPES